MQNELKLVTNVNSIVTIKLRCHNGQPIRQEVAFSSEIDQAVGTIHVEQHSITNDSNGCQL